MLNLIQIILIETPKIETGFSGSELFIFSIFVGWLLYLAIHDKED